MFGIGTYIILKDDNLVLQMPDYPIILLWGTTIATLIFWGAIAFYWLDDDEETVETKESCIGFTCDEDEDEDDDD